MSLPQSYPVLVHNYLPSANADPTRPLQTYEHLPSLNPEQKPENALVFLCGLGDGPHSIPYVRRLAEHLAVTAPGWSVFEARLGSNFSAFGYGSLAEDVREVRRTGCQDCLEYAKVLVAERRRGTGRGGVEGAATEEEEEEEEGGEDEEVVRVDGYVLQGPVSDREAIAMAEDAREVAAAIREAEEMRRQGRGSEVMPVNVLPKGWRGSPVSAYRWWSLAAVGGDDDYFSSDLPESRLAEIWGNLDVPVLIMPSGKEEWVPASLNVPAMVERWKSFAKPGIVSELSGLIPGANHRVDNDEGREWLIDRVARFLHEVEGRT
ncbi:hypothetical protein VTJ49DRAFT_1884 [Mycothermus thermophilus]|uniref:Uncharacterized protein n=1 Tax=Humicola insolens TaxID=85995 RepID=A0ABR3VBI6_HUMIN